MKSPALVAVLVLACLLVLPAVAGAEDVGAKKAPVQVPPRPVDLVICLDTSGSMQGLINSARKKLWSVVSELATAKPMPDLRVALLTYGSPGNDAAGHVILQSDLTRDLDLISEKLFALTTRGGNEYVGRVTRHALDHVAWSRGDALKLIFVAGNESADQDRTRPYLDQAKLAVSKGVMVNAIYCGGADDGDAGGYRQLAAIGNGRFANIDHNQGTVAIITPFDKELAELSVELNKTYVAYGDRAEVQKLVARQSKQDANAAKAGAPAAAERAKAKSGRLYRNATWDLVDKMEEKDFDLAKIPVKELPEAMQKMTLEERKAFLLSQKNTRLAIQAKVKALSAKRDAFVKAEMKKQKLDDTKALDRALRDAIREQAANKGFTFGD